MAQRLTGISGVGGGGNGENIAPRRLGPVRHAGLGAPVLPPGLSMGAVAPVRAVSAIPSVQTATAAPEPAPSSSPFFSPPPTPVEPRFNEAELAARVREAAEQAWRRGHEEGLVQAQKDHAQVQQRLLAAIETAAAAFDAHLGDAETLATALASQTLLQLLGEPAAHTSLLGSLLRHQLSGLRQGSEIGVRMNPQDLLALGDPAVWLDARLPPHGPRVRLRGDSGLPPGGCALDLDQGSLDAGLDTARELIRQHFQPLGGDGHDRH